MSRKTIPVGLNWTGATISPGGRWIATGPPEGSVLLGDLSGTNLVTQTLEGPLQPVIGIDFSSDDRFLAGSSCHEGSLMASTCTRGEAWVWDLNSGSRIGPLTGSDDTIGNLDLSDDGRWLVTSGSELLIWDLASGKPRPVLVSEAPGSGPDAFTFVEISPDGQWLAAAQPEGIHLWHLSETGEWVDWQLEGGFKQPQQLAFDPGSNLLVGGSFAGEIAFWELSTGELKARPEKQQLHQIYALVFNEDGSQLASGSLDGRIVVWDVAQLLEGDDLSPDLLIKRACDIVNRNLSPIEWETYFGDQPYRQSCKES
jgi:WD40 repeat protein